MAKSKKYVLPLIIGTTANLYQPHKSQPEQEGPQKRYQEAPDYTIVLVEGCTCSRVDRLVNETLIRFDLFLRLTPRLFPV